MIGILFSILAGISMSLQGVLNTRLSEKAGPWQATFVVQGLGLIVAFIIVLFTKSFDFSGILRVQKPYLLGGAIGVLIVFAVMKGIGILGTTCAISIILISQLLSAALIDYFGILGTEPTSFGATKIIGVIIMCLGVLIFRLKC
jgi:bacterial/archaeal transporter family-2 protein